MEEAHAGVPEEDREGLVKASQKCAGLCAMLKLFSTELAHRAADHYVQTLGGNGYMEEYPASALYRAVRVMKIYEGTSEINRQTAVAVTLQRFARDPILMRAVPYIFQDAGDILSGNGMGKNVPISLEQLLENMEKSIIYLGGLASLKYSGSTLMEPEQQSITLRLGNILTSLYMMQSALDRAKKIGGGNDKLPMNLARAFIYGQSPDVYKWATEILPKVTEGESLESGLEVLEHWLNPLARRTFPLICTFERIAAHFIDAGKWDLS